MDACVQSARLWYETFKSFLIKIEFVMNPYDICVFNKFYGGNQCTICFHVDDILITCKDDSVIKDIIFKMRGEYQEIKVSEGLKHSYLGRTLDFSDERYSMVSMASA